jgi:hypothetical protein
MGNEIYYEGKVPQRKSTLNIDRAFSAWANDGLLNYKGMNTSSSDSEKNDNKNNFSSNSDSLSSSSSSQLELDEDTIEETQEDNSKVPFTFYWKEGGNKVQLTGNFVNWNQYFEMTEYEKGNFKCEIILPKQEIYFKFIVDNKWVFSNNYEKRDDGHYNINNYIDLTNYKIEEKKENNENKKKIQKKEKKTKNEKNKEKEIWCIPKNQDQMNAEAPCTPFHYQDPWRININSNQIIIGRSKFLSFNYNSINDESNSYKKILYPEHINIFHILFPCIGNKNYSKVGLYYRFKQKAITFIYYKPY